MLLSRRVQVSDSARLGLDVVAWLVWGTLMAVMQLQSPMFFGLVTNPFYRCTTATADGAVHHPVRQQRLGKLYNVLRMAAPALTVAYTSALFSSPRVTSNVLVAFATVRAYRWAWQAPTRALLEVRRGNNSNGRAGDSSSTARVTETRRSEDCAKLEQSLT